MLRSRSAHSHAASHDKRDHSSTHGPAKTDPTPKSGGSDNFSAGVLHGYQGAEASSHWGAVGKGPVPPGGRGGGSGCFRRSRRPMNVNVQKGTAAMAAVSGPSEAVDWSARHTQPDVHYMVDRRGGALAVVDAELVTQEVIEQFRQSRKAAQQQQRPQGSAPRSPLPEPIRRGSDLNSSRLTTSDNLSGLATRTNSERAPIRARDTKARSSVAVPRQHRVSAAAVSPPASPLSIHIDESELGHTVGGGLFLNPNATLSATVLLGGKVMSAMERAAVAAAAQLSLMSAILKTDEGLVALQHSVREAFNRTSTAEAAARAEVMREAAKEKYILQQHEEMVAHRALTSIREQLRRRDATLAAIHRAFASLLEDERRRRTALVIHEERTLVATRQLFGKSYSEILVARACAALEGLETQRRLRIMDTLEPAARRAAVNAAPEHKYLLLPCINPFGGCTMDATDRTPCCPFEAAANCPFPPEVPIYGLRIHPCHHHRSRVATLVKTGSVWCDEGSPTSPPTLNACKTTSRSGNPDVAANILAEALPAVSSPRRIRAPQQSVLASARCQRDGTECGIDEDMLHFGFKKQSVAGDVATL